MKAFDKYMKGKAYAASTIQQNERYASQFLSWLDAENLTAKQCNYNEILSFIESRKQEGESVNLINRKLLAIRHYYSCLQEKNKRLQNPAANLYLRRTRKKIVSGTLDFEKLEMLYKSSSNQNDRDKRNRLILGLLIYQALTTDELHKLRLENIKLKEGKIEVPGSKRTNSRILYLQAIQILELQEYLKRIRPKLKQSRTDQFLLSMEGNINLKNSLLHMFRNLKNSNPDIRNPKQIRQSIIVHWLRTYNLREVQYMAGHKYVSSTERYQMNNIEDLQKEIGKYHPLN